LQLLAAKKRKGLLDFERVVIETTGLADPGPVAQTFFMDDEIAESFLLDSILTLVDAKHAAQQLNDRQEARRQVGFADQMFISKADLVSATELDALQHRLKHMNPRAPQKVVHFGEVSLAEVFDLRGFNLNAKLDIDPDFLSDDAHHEHHHGEHCDHPSHKHDHHDHHDHEHGEHCDHPSHQHDHGHSHGHGHHHHHDDDVKSFVYKSKRPFDPAKLEDFLGAIVNIYGPKMLRYKGVLNMKGTERKVIFQGVHQLMGSDLGPEWGKDEERISKMVFIGIDLPKDILVQGLEQSLV
jgi:G3E family GTPase